MKLTAFLLAFGNEIPVPTREIEIPQSDLEQIADDLVNEGINSFSLMKEAGRAHVLDLAFKYGQNDFQSRPIRSVSVGDVVKLLDGSLYRVLGSGWEKLPAETDINKLERGMSATFR